MRFIKTKKFIDNSISIRSIFPFDKNKITQVNLALLMMKSKTQKFPTKQEISLVLNEMYHCKVSFHLSGLGEYLVFEYRFQYLQSSYCPKPYAPDRLIEILDQFLFHSLVDMESFKECKILYENMLIHLQEDTDYLASAACLSLLDNKHTASVSIHGYRQDLDQITFQDMVDTIANLQRLPKHVFACGDIEKPILTYLESMDQALIPYTGDNLYQGNTSIEKTLTRDISQTSLCQVYQTQITIQDVEYDALNLMNLILGQCPNNLLFDVLREQKSLCYEVRSSLIRFDGLLMIQAGLSKKDRMQALACIDEQIERIQKGEYSDLVFENAKRDWIDGLHGIRDLPFTWIERIFLNSMLKDSRTMAQKISVIQRITKEDVSKAASKLKKCAQVFVEGINEEV